MKVKVLVCRPDGTQSVEIRELPENWFDSSDSEDTEEEK